MLETWTRAILKTLARALRVSQATLTQPLFGPETRKYISSRGLNIGNLTRKGTLQYLIPIPEKLGNSLIKEN
mgnify:CR=1 FL=1